jgi:hypothetical protein
MGVPVAGAMIEKEFYLVILFRMLQTQSLIKNPLTLLPFGLAVVLFMGTFVASADAALLFDEPVRYIIGDHEPDGTGGQISDTVVADFNSDGYLDIAGTIPESVINEDEIPNPDQGVVILINDGDGNFTITDYIAYGEQPLSIVSADLDGDGDVDLATLNAGLNDLAILINDGTGEFGITSRPGIGDGPEKLASADFDGDGDIDLGVTVNEGSPNNSGVQIFANDGSSNFTLITTVRVSPLMGISDITVADFDGDTDIDLAVGSDNERYAVMLNGGNWIFTISEVSQPGVSTQRLASTDIDDDGDNDLIFIGISTLINDGNASFTLNQNPDPLFSGDVISPADIDGDEDIDIVIPLGSNGASILTNDATGSFVLDTSIFMGALEQITSIHSADLNNDGKKDIVLSSTGQWGVWTVLQTPSENPTPQEQATALVTDVITFDFPNNVENSYLANLFKVEGFIENGQITPAINQLNAFISKVNQDYNQGTITQSERNTLVTAAQQLIDDLTN